MSQTYYTILTKQGAALLANATALGVPLKLTQMGVGDGNGSIPKPIATQTKLVHEVRRAAINTLFIDKQNPNQIIAEQVIPENEGGWFIHEIGLYDDKGNLIAVGNCPATYKPKLVEGSGRTQVIRMVIIVDNVNSVELKIDPSVVLATREYVDNLIATKMEAHEKSTNHPTATTKSKGFVQLSSATNSTAEDQAATPLAVKNTYDLASVIIDSFRPTDFESVIFSPDKKYHAVVRNDGILGFYNSHTNRLVWSIAPDGGLNDGYVNTDRVNGLDQFINQTNNNLTHAHNRISNINNKFGITDFESAVFSGDKNYRFVVRNDGIAGVYCESQKKFVWFFTNEGWVDGLISADRVGGLDQFIRDRCVPVGAPIPWPQTTPPGGWFECNGSQFNKSWYPKLAKAYPSGYLPDLRGEFIRGWDNGRGVDPGRSILYWQAQQVSAHRHVGGLGENFSRSEPWRRERMAPFGSTGDQGIWGGVLNSDIDNPLFYTNDGTNGGITIQSTTTRWDDLNPVGLVGNETRPRNVAFMYIVKAE